MFYSDGRNVFLRVISRKNGCPWGTSGKTSATWLDVPVVSVPVNTLIATQDGIFFQPLIGPVDVPVGGDVYPHVIVWGGENYLEDGHHRVVRAMLTGLETIEARVLVLEGVVSRP